MTEDADRFVSDVLTNGIGVTLNGKHIPLEQVYIMPEKAFDKIEAGLKDALEIARGGKQLPLYTCHKQVRALEIRTIGAYSYEPSPEARLVREVVFADPDYPPLKLDESLFARYVPMPGDYYVVYEDGYQSFSPRKAFLEGYSLASDGNVLMERLNDVAMAGPGVAPSWLQGMDWSQQLARVAREAHVTINSQKAEIERLRAILRQCVRGTDFVDLGSGESLLLHLPHKSGIADE
jgi:hypothetical protein